MTDQSLCFVGLHPRTLRSYKRALLSFFLWLEDEELPIPARSSQLDESLAQYLEHLWLGGVNVTYAGHTLSAFRKFYPAMRLKLPTAKQFFTNWKSVHVPRQAVPMPANVAMALAGVAITIQEQSLALLILLGFTTFLRTSEIIQLKPGQVHVDVDKGVIILALPASKTSKNKEESVAVYDPLLCRFAQHVLQARQGPSLSGLTANQFRSRLQRLCAFLHLQRHNFTGYSLRRGGASHSFLMGKHFDELLVAGRWQRQSVKTARQYLDSGRAALVQLHLSPRSASLVDHFQSQITFFCEQLRQKRTSQR